MKLSPRIIQAMEILQLPLQALEERIEEELTANPVLELREHAAEDAAGAEAPELTPADRGEETMVVGSEDTNKDFERLDDFGDTYSEQFEWSDRPSRGGSDSGQRDAKMDALANTPAPDQNLAEFLLEQWAFVEASEPVREAGEAIINALDGDGYLRVTLEELVTSEPPVTVDALRAALPLVQRLEPPGVGARDLGECLLIQLASLESSGVDVALPRLLVGEYLREIERNHIPLIARKTGKTVAEINEALAGLARLDPRPGRSIGSANAPHVKADAIVDLDENGNVVIQMTEGDLPALRISKTYRQMARSGQMDTQVKDFLRRNMRSAQWLISAIQQRQHTVRRVIEEVFAAQKEFLEHGPEVLRPLPMADIAAKVGVHVATVSRAVAGKHVQTPQGIVPLRMFFSGGTTTASGEDVAWDAVKAKLKEVVEQEDKSSPLDDDQIAQALQQAGIKVARRTVAKYRGLLSIPPARQRKQF